MRPAQTSRISADDIAAADPGTRSPRLVIAGGRVEPEHRLIGAARRLQRHELMPLILGGAVAMLVPVVLAITIFPTAMSDTRELISWGRAFPLVTPKHPPMMAWVGGLSDWAFGQSAVAAVLVSQVLTAIGVVYVYRTLALVIARQQAALLAFLFAASIYVVAAPLSYALNADILQIASWPAVVYYALAAARFNRVRDWIALGAFIAAAVLTKYNAAVLILGLLATAVVVEEFRRLFLNPRFYLTVAVGALLTAPHLIALLAFPQAVTRAGELLVRHGGLAGRLSALGSFAVGYLFFLAPAWIFIVIGRVRGDLAFAAPRQSPQVFWVGGARFLLALSLAMNTVLLALIVVFGLPYLRRFAAPYLPMLVLAVGPLIVWNLKAFEDVSRRILWASVSTALWVFAGGTVLYAFAFGHDRMQEPTGQAARIVMADWYSRYSCPPRYFIGEAPSVFGVGNAASPDMLALSDVMVPATSWFDRRALDTYGGVLLYRRAVPLGDLEQMLPGIKPTAPKEFALPLLRTTALRPPVTYHYSFIPPRPDAAGRPCLAGRARAEPARLG